MRRITRHGEDSTPPCLVHAGRVLGKASASAPTEYAVALRLGRKAMAQERVERRLAAILAADVASYSRLMGADEEGTLRRLKALRRELLDPKIAEHHGRIVKTTGDGLLVEFASVVDAVRCAVAVQQAMPERNSGVAADDRIELRIGINLGDVIVEGDDLYGDGINIAARIEALADAGGVLVSNTVHEHVRDRLPFVFEDLGEQQVKNIARPVRVYRVRDAAAKSASTPAPPALPLPDKPSIAVLPFANMSGDPEQEFFVDGVVEEIITAIARLHWLFVIARNSSFAYKGKSPDLRQVGRELGVRYVLEGSVRKSGNRVRITGQLIDTAIGAHIWADRFDGTLNDIFELQDEVASHVVGAIEPKLRQTEIERASRKPTESLDAYDLYLRALAQSHKYTGEGMREAVALMKQALVIDPSYAPATAMIGWCYGLQRLQSWGPFSNAEAAEAVHLARRAIEVGKDDPDALWMAANTVSFFAGDHAAAGGAIDRALILNPSSAHAWLASGLLSYRQNRADPAVEAFERGMRLSPLDPLGYAFTGGLAAVHVMAGRYKEAVEWADRSLRELPRYESAIRNRLVACAHLDRIEEARDGLGQLLEITPGLTIARYRALYTITHPPELIDLHVKGLRKAGLPEG
jgi:TolB-like protein/class 3 adenylate cyclase/Tfp pilus assembly protein PilF